ncbi:MAG: hypothetical protein E7530_04620 [Ruminococcaceae bacterium]|nr:hypothetical protein [Oscillospiraceae bacterium]
MKRNYFYDDITNIVMAEETIAKESKKIEKSKKGLVVAAVSMLVWGFGVVAACIQSAIYLPRPWTDIFGVITLGVIFVGFVGCIVSYFLSGSVLETLKIVGKIGFWGWFIIPFPFDIITGLAVMFLTLCAFFSCPIAVLGIIHLIRKNRIKKAEKFLVNFADVQERYNIQNMNY